jgi:hypothetical protein
LIQERREKERLALIPDVDVIEGKVPCLSHRARLGVNTGYQIYFLGVLRGVLFY